MKISTFTYNNILKKNFLFYFWVWDKKTKINKLVIKLYNINTLLLYNNIYFIPFSKTKFLLITFSFYLNIIKNLLNLNEKALIISFYLKLSVIGIGYKLFYLNKILILILNYSHNIKIKFINQINFNIIVDDINNFIILKSPNKYLLGNFTYIIKFFRMFNSYNNSGIRNIYDYLKKTKNLKLKKKKLN